MNVRHYRQIIIVALLFLSFSLVITNARVSLSSRHRIKNGDSSTTPSLITSTSTSTESVTNDGQHNINSNANSSGGSSTNNQQDANILILIFIAMLTGSVFVAYFVVSLHIPFIPESIAIVLYGVILGILFRFTNSDLVHHVVTFDPEKFFLFILPTIIFETGFSLPKTDFFSHIGGIFLFAVFGTIISFAVTGAGIFLVGEIGWSMALPVKESFLFGAITSATDPVCTLAIFQALNVEPTLYMLVLGESILNDATAIMLYRTVISFSAEKIWLNILSFVLVSVGSIAMGVAMALMLSLMLKWVNIGRFPALETIFMILSSYASYVLANSLDFSGILAVFFCGITFNQYGAYSLSPYTKLTSRQLFRTAAFVCETCVFVYMGISVSFHDFTFHAGLFSWSIISKNKVSIPIQVAIWFAGLRGAVAFSLSLDTESMYSEYLQTDTLLIVIFTLFVFGVGTYPLLKLLGIKSSTSDQSLDNISKPMNKQHKEKQRTKLYQSIDDKYFKKWFRKKVPPLATEAIAIFEKLVQNSTQDPHQELSTYTYVYNDEFLSEEDDQQNHGSGSGSGGASSSNNNNNNSNSNTHNNGSINRDIDIERDIGYENDLDPEVEVSSPLILKTGYEDKTSLI
eukprot:gene4178-5228_t